MNKKLWTILTSSQILFAIAFPIWIKLADYLHIIVIGVIWVSLTLFAYLIGLYVSETTIHLKPWKLHAFMLLYTSSLLVLLFFRPNEQNHEAINLVPFSTIEYYLTSEVSFLIAFYNLAANIALFIPLGIYFRFVYQKSTLPKVLLISILSVSCIELFQYISHRGTLDIDDLILNVLGMIIGYFLQPILAKVILVNN